MLVFDKFIVSTRRIGQKLIWTSCIYFTLLMLQGDNGPIRKMSQTSELYS